MLHDNMCHHFKVVNILNICSCLAKGKKCNSKSTRLVQGHTLTMKQLTNKTDGTGGQT